MKKDLISQNYAKYIRSPKFETTTTTCTLTANDIQVKSKKDDLPYVDTIFISIYTGLRIDELFKTCTADV